MENVNSKDQILGVSKEDLKSDESTKSQSKKSDLAKEKLAGLHFLKQSFRTLSVPKKSSSKIIVEKDKNEPTRFLGEGVTFKAKLIGILEVEEARGDRMCQEALYELKMAVRAAGEHKQRINIVIAVDGIRLRDEKTGDCLHHHPVHKISFIAQDVADSRAFGYIFGSPDTTHRFFGIKTDKAASQVVMTMRDLFQAVFELKKREVEVARQNIEQHHAKYGSSLFLDSVPASLKSISDSRESIVKSKASVREDTNKNAKNKTQTATVIADLMDLELELNSLQQGLSQMEKLTPSDPFGPSPSVPKEDPFGDSFTPPPCITTPPPTKLPPPPASGDRRKVGSSSSAASQPELHWFDKETQDLFANDRNTSAVESGPEKDKKEDLRASESTSKDLYDIFTDLDPLGTGRSKPYMDKKDFFQELKNPPKKQLKDLKGHDGGDKVNFANDSKALFSEDTEKLYDEHFRKYNSVDSDRRITLAEELAKSDPYFESVNDPFETSFANFASFDNIEERRRSPHIYRRSPSSLQEHHTTNTNTNTTTTSTSTNDSLHNNMIKPSTKSTYRHTESGFPPPITSQSADTFLQQQQRYRPKWSRPNDDLSKQKIVINLRKVLSSADDTDKENDSPVMEEATILKNMDAMSPGQGEMSSDSFESIPEPPPRPAASPMAAQPPPLPPKKLLLPVMMKPPPRPATDSNSHYDYIENYESVGSRQKLNGDVQIPPLPAPARKPKFSQDDVIGRHRPHHRQHQQSIASSEYYLTPISKSQPEHHHQRDDRQQQQRRVKPSLDITLSQLSSTNFEDLATMLRIPASALSKMTLKELTECLSRLSEAECLKLESNMSSRAQKSDDINPALTYRSLRESFDDDVIHPSTNTTVNFKVNFEEKFPTQSVQQKQKTQQQQVDKYAVFRELIEEEKKNQGTETFTQPCDDGGLEKTAEEEDHDIDDEKPKNVDGGGSDMSDADKYAALRMIPGAMTTSDSKSGDENAKELSEKEDSAAEVMLPAEDSEAGGAGELPKEQDPLDSLAESVGKLELQASADGQVIVDTPTKAEDENDAAQVNVLGKNWAKFDLELDSKDHQQPQRSKTPSWPGDADESTFDVVTTPKVDEDEAIIKPFRYRKHRHSRHGRWNDDDVEEDEDDDYGDDSEENWESSKRSLGSSWEESSWRENGWSDRDSLYDDAEGSPPPPVPAVATAAPSSYREQKLQLRKKGYHRKFSSSPHKKSTGSGSADSRYHSHHLDQQHSPWDEEDPPDWQVRKYKDDERKVRTPPWTSGSSGIERSKRWDEQKDVDELMLLKMMLGKKRLKVLEEQLFRHYHEQLSSDSSKKSSSYYQYARDSDGEANNTGNKMRYARNKYYTQRPKSADKVRKAGSGGLQLRQDDTEELFANKKYRRRPYSQDELSISEEERWVENRSPLHRKPPTGAAVSRSRHQSQTSPFEDNFTTTAAAGTSAQSYELTDSPVDSIHLQQHHHHYVHPHHKSKTLRYPSSGSAAVAVASSKKMDASKRSPHELHPYSSSSVYDFRSTGGGRSSRESSQRQSPFEDDFTPPEMAQKSGDSGGGNGAGKDGPIDDDVFFSSSGTGESGGRGVRGSGSNRAAARGYAKRCDKMSTSSKYYENVEVRKKVPDSFYEKIAKEKYKYAAVKEGNGESMVELKSPKKGKGLDEGRRHDPFNDNMPQQQQQSQLGGYESKTVPRLQKVKSKNKMQQQQQHQLQYESESDSAEAALKWKDDFGFADPHSRK